MEDDFRRQESPQGCFPVEAYHGPERSIGGADLSGILTLEDEDNFVEFASSIAQNSPSTITNASPIRPSVSFLDEAGRNLARGDALALEQEKAESDEWDSDYGQGGGGGARTDVTSRTGDRGGVTGGLSSGRRFGALGERGGEGSSKLAGDGNGVASTKCSHSSPGSNCSNPNISSPTRPAEEGSDWDEDMGRSSDDVENDSDGDRRRPMSSNREEEVRRGSRGSTGSTGIAGVLDGSAGSDSSGKPFTGLSPFRPSEHSSDAAESANTTKGGVVERNDGRGHARGSSRSGGGGGEAGKAATRETLPVASRPRDDRAALEKAAATAAEATIEALQAELRSLRDHVLRSEQRREAQLRELDARLEAQERQGGPPPGRADSERARLKETSERDAGVLGTEGAVEARRCGHKHDAGTPHGPGFHNPFAGTGGGAATPRDHFPAFEDALHDGGDDEGGQACGEEVGGKRGIEQVDKSLYQNEAFDFSIETLSHINNHTDFGTDAPTRALLPAAVAATSPSIRREGKAGAKRDRGSLPWALTASAPGLSIGGGGLEVEEGDEPFDARDRAAEEAFFGDACATASLQTPVKHVLATTAVCNAGVATRKVKLDGRSVRGTPAERPSVESLVPAGGGARSPLYLNEEQGHHHPRRRPPGTREGVQPGRRNAASEAEEDAESDPNWESSDLCMADFFARASAELGKSSEDESGRARGPSAARKAETPSKKGATMFRSKVENGQSVGGVDAATQTAWSFAAHENVRLVSATVRAEAARTSMGDENVYRQRPDVKDWSGRPGSVENPEALPSPGFCAAYTQDGGDTTGRERALGGSHPNTGDGRKTFSAPRCSRPPLWQSPASRSQRDCDASPADASPADRRGEMSSGPAFFGSPNLSPVTGTSMHPGRASIAVDDVVGASTQNQASPKKPNGKGEERREEGGDYTRSSAGRMTPPTPPPQQQQYRGDNRGRSPILSERGGGSCTVSSGDGGARLSLAQQARVNCVEAASVLSETSANNRAARWRGEDRSGQGDTSGRKNCAYLKSAQASRTAAAAVDRSSQEHPLFVGSSGDITRSSVLRASTTLDTIAPLDDTTRSLSFHSRGGNSFPGELFHDSNFQPYSSAEPVPRYGRPQPQREHLYRRSDGAAAALVRPLMQQHQQQRRSRSAPTLLSERSTDNRMEPARRDAAIARSSSPDSGAVPPAVVGAWLAATIEGIYFRNGRNGQAAGSSQARDARESLPGFGAALDPDPDIAPGTSFLAVNSFRRRRANSVPLLGGRAGAGVDGTDDQHGDHRRSAGVLSPYPPGRGDSPPPPPPPPETQLEAAHDDNDGDGGGGGDLANDEEMFYQRQRLLQRVVSAAASHGGVTVSHGGNAASYDGVAASHGRFDSSHGGVVPLPPFGSIAGSVATGTAGASPEREQDIGEILDRDAAWRRHSDPDPMSWEIASVPSAALGGGDSRVGGANGWAGRGTPDYLRRQTSGYWRDKLGMTQ